MYAIPTGWLPRPGEHIEETKVPGISFTLFPSSVFLNTAIA